MKIIETFSVNKRILWANEFKEWFFTFVFAAFLYLALQFFFTSSNSSIVVGFMVWLLLNISRTLTQYHVSQIRIDSQSCRLTLVLNSIMSGEKVKVYDLRNLKSELIIASGMARYFDSSLILKLYFKPKDVFRISSRYGFSTETLVLVDGSIKLVNNLSSTQ